MNTEVAIRHHEYPSRVRAHVEPKLEHLGKYYERTHSIKALLEREGDAHRVELVANVGRGVVLVVDERAPSFGAAVDEAVHRMARVLTKHKGRLTERRRARSA